MRTASMVLGIVGGAIALILAIALFVGGSFIASVPWMDYNNSDWNFNDSSDWNSDNSSDWNWNEDYSSEELNSLLDNLDSYNSDYVDSLQSDIIKEMPEVVQSGLSALFIFPAICAAIAGVLGLVGGIIVKKSNVAAGVLMIIAAVLSLFSFFNIISMALFIVGAVFALMRDRSKQQPVYVPPYQIPPNYTYPQQPYAPQPYTPPVYPQPEQPQQPVPPVDNPPENPQP